MRVTPITIANDIINNLENTYSNIQTLDQQLSSGKRIQRPSDDPAGTAYAVDMQSGMDWNQQYQKSSQSATAWLQATTTALQQLSDVASRARTLAEQGANDVNTATDRSGLAQEMAQLVQQTVQIGNTTYAGSAIFAGTLVNSTPFNTLGGYSGNAGAITHQIASGFNMQVNANPTAIFTGTSGIFNTLNSLLQHLNTTPTMQPTANGGSEAMNLTGTYTGAPANYTVQVTSVAAGQITGIQYSTTGGAPWTAVAGVGTPPTFALGSGMTGSFTNGALAPQVGDQFNFTASGAVLSSTFAITPTKNIGNEQVVVTGNYTGAGNPVETLRPALLDANNNVTAIRISTDGGATFGPVITANEVQPAAETLSYSAMNYTGPSTSYLVRAASVTAGNVTNVTYSTDNGATWSAPVPGTGSPAEFLINPNISVTFNPGTAQVGDQFALTATAGSVQSGIAGTSALAAGTKTTFTGSAGLNFALTQSTINPSLVVTTADTFTYTPPATGLNQDLSALDAVISNLAGQQAQFGAQTNAVTANIGQQQSLSLQMQRTLSQTADADIAALSTRMATANTVYQAALAVDARSIEPTLISFLH